MNEQDLFDIMDGLTERQIAEAAEWKYRQGKAQSNEIDSILTGGTMPEKITYRQTAPETETAAAEPVKVSSPAGNERPSRVIRSATAGLAAVAAVFALIFGGIALKLHRDNSDILASMPGAAVSEGEIAVTEINAESGSTYTVTGTDWDVINSVPEYGTTVTFAPEETPAEYIEDNTVSAGETNFLGGNGLLRPVTAEGQPCILQDDEYIYLYGSEKIRKSGLDALKAPDPELICQKAGCAHTSDDCLLYKYGFSQLMSSGTDIYLIDHSTESVQQGFAGGLKRIYSDGTTEDIHPQKQISAADESSGKMLGNIYYTHILRLGDTGIYYLKGYGSPDETGGIREFMPVLLNSRTGETITLQNRETGHAYIDDYAVMYDEASGHLFLSITNGFTGTCTAINEIDIYTGEILQEYNSWGEQAEIISWFVRDHQLHYLGETPENQYKVNWYVRDMDTQETKMLQADCGFSSFAYCDGRVYATYHASVGNDAVYSCAPDGTDAVKLTESNTLFRSLMPVASPDCIGINSNTGSIYVLLPDGQTYRLM